MDKKVLPLQTSHSVYKNRQQVLVTREVQCFQAAGVYKLITCDLKTSGSLKCSTEPNETEQLGMKLCKKLYPSQLFEAGYSLKIGSPLETIFGWVLLCEYNTAAGLEKNIKVKRCPFDGYGNMDKKRFYLEERK